MGKSGKHKRDKSERREAKKNKKDKREKRKREEEEEEETTPHEPRSVRRGRNRRELSAEGSSPAKKVCLDRLDRNSLTSPSRELPSRSCAVKQKSSGGAGTLEKFLQYLLPILEEKDVNCFFAMPVPDTFAPGYSKIITKPMDFSTIRSKLEGGSYKSLEEFRSDFELICTNCMSYNGPDTSYYKAAKKLLQHGERILSEERLRALAVHLPMMKDLTTSELGFQLDHETPPPDMTPEDQRDMLASLGFLRTMEDGSTSLPIIQPGTGVVEGTERDRPVSLGTLIGKVKSGTSSLQGFREDRRNVAKTIHPLYYGAFSSHGPTYDSTFANLTKRETELVYTANSDEAVAAERNVKVEEVSFMADHILDILTNNEHRKSTKYDDQEKMFNSTGEDGKTENIDFDSLKTLSDEGIDMSFLDNLAKKLEEKQDEPGEEKAATPTPDGRLEKTAELLENLIAMQYDRLSAPPPQNLSQIQQPSQKELELAEKVQESLADMTGSVKPSDVVNVAAIRKAMGISAGAVRVAAN